MKKCILRKTVKINCFSFEKSKKHKNFIFKFNNVLLKSKNFLRFLLYVLLNKL